MSLGIMSDSLSVKDDRQGIMVASTADNNSRLQSL